MVCSKCNYRDTKETTRFNESLCSLCIQFAPHSIFEFQKYTSEKVDWKLIETFRKRISLRSKSLKEGMRKSAKKGNIVSRAPLGYELYDGILIQNEDASKVHHLFKIFLDYDYSLSALSKQFHLSINGIKKILTNRTYLGEIKYDKRTYKGNHQAIISPELFYAVQRKLNTYLHPQKKEK